MAALWCLRQTCKPPVNQRKARKPKKGAARCKRGVRAQQNRGKVRACVENRNAREPHMGADRVSSAAICVMRTSPKPVRVLEPAASRKPQQESICAGVNQKGPNWNRRGGVKVRAGAAVNRKNRCIVAGRKRKRREPGAALKRYRTRCSMLAG